jgi:hypothetical protein
MSGDDAHLNRLDAPALMNQSQLPIIKYGDQ